MKTKRPNTPETSVTNMDTTDMGKVKVPFTVKVCKSAEHLVNFASSLFHIPHTKSQTRHIMNGLGGHTKTQKPAGETNLSDWDLSSPQYNPDSQLEVDKHEQIKLRL